MSQYGEFYHLLPQIAMFIIFMTCGVYAGIEFTKITYRAGMTFISKVFILLTIAFGIWWLFMAALGIIIIFKQYN